MGYTVRVHVAGVNTRGYLATSATFGLGGSVTINICRHTGVSPEVRPIAMTSTVFCDSLRGKRGEVRSDLCLIGI